MLNPVSIDAIRNVAELARQAEACRDGDPLDMNSQIGAVHSEARLEGNLDFGRTAEGGERRL
ncbi:hypothetical protein [Pseudooceanicola sp.]|uniref:hypothetical protein n=1 Tax=Pseudooceanicola sp. TaxID=1914328 RepID=UPI0035C76440